MAVNNLVNASCRQLVFNLVSMRGIPALSLDGKESRGVDCRPFIVQAQIY